MRSPWVAGFEGTGEQDLMKVVLSKPVAIPGLNTITLSVTSSSTPGVVPAVKFWSSPTKNNQPVALDANGKIAIPVNNVPGELWMEFAGVSLAFGDVMVRMQYGDAFDRVSATGIWTKYNDANKGNWPDGYFYNHNDQLPFDNQFTRELPADPSEDNVPRPVLEAAFSRVVAFLDV